MADYGAEPVVGIRLNGDAPAAAAGQVHDAADMMYDGHGYSSINGDSAVQQQQQQQYTRGR
jgi:hypothetical protein